MSCQPVPGRVVDDEVTGDDAHEVLAAGIARPQPNRVADLRQERLPRSARGRSRPARPAGRRRVVGVGRRGLAGWYVDRAWRRARGPRRTSRRRAAQEESDVRRLTGEQVVLSGAGRGNVVVVRGDREARGGPSTGTSEAAPGTWGAARRRGRAASRAEEQTGHERQPHSISATATSWVRWSVSSRTTCSEQSTPAETPRRGQHALGRAHEPLPAHHGGRGGRGRQLVERESWCVVAGRSSRSPAAPSTSAPVHTEISISTSPARSRSQASSRSSSQQRVGSPAPPGTTSRSEGGASSRGYIGSTVNPAPAHRRAGGAARPRRRRTAGPRPARRPR